MADEYLLRTAFRRLGTSPSRATKKQREHAQAMVDRYNAGLLEGANARREPHTATITVRGKELTVRTGKEPTKQRRKMPETNNAPADRSQRAQE